MVLHSGVCMGACHLSQLLVAPQSCPYGEQFQIHHIVDDHRVLPSLAQEVPTAYHTCSRIHALCQFLCSSHQHLPAILIVRQAIGVAIAAVQLEADVVVGMHLQQGLQLLCLLQGHVTDGRRLSELIDIPQAAGKESTAPPVQVGGAQRAVGIQRTGHGAVCELLVKHHILLFCQAEDRRQLLVGDGTSSVITTGSQAKHCHQE